MVSHIQRNVEMTLQRNKLIEIENSLIVIPHVWGETMEWHRLRGHNRFFDVFLAADVIYSPQNFSCLISSILTTSNENTRILLAFQRRSGEEISFVHEFNQLAMRYGWQLNVNCIAYQRDQSSKEDNLEIGRIHLSELSDPGLGIYVFLLEFEKI